MCDNISHTWGNFHCSRDNKDSSSCSWRLFKYEVIFPHIIRPTDRLPTRRTRHVSAASELRPLCVALGPPHLSVCFTALVRRSTIFTRSSLEQVSSSVRSWFRSSDVTLPNSSSSRTMLSALMSHTRTRACHHVTDGRHAE